MVAEPGAGKTTRVPPSLLGAGPVLLLQPRRAAARAIAQRIAAEHQWGVGREVGWQVRLERRFSAATRLLVVTEGILTARLQQDPLLSTFSTIVLDEFHERSIHADLGLALARQAWLAREDLRIVIMSATIDAEHVASFLEDCPIVRVAGLTHPLDVSYAPEETLSDAASRLINVGKGDVLCFLPGAFEIQKAVGELRARTPSDVDVLPLHGGQRADEQELALSGSATGGRRIIVATNIAETSVTVPGVCAVVDAGLQKVARYDAARAIDSLSTERITQDAADQRAGRAGRLGPGVVRRLWDPRDRLQPHREPDIRRIDLSSAVLQIAAWGGDAKRFEWFEPPRPDSLDAAIDLLERLDALRAGVVTETGRLLQRLPLHPRLGRIVVAGAGARAVCQACAILSERWFLPPRIASTSSDLLSVLDDWHRLPQHIQQTAREIEQTASAAGISCDTAAALTDEQFRRALLAGYPDRVAQRRSPQSSRLKLATGTGAALASESGVHEGTFLVALDVRAPNQANDPDSRVRIASRIEREWLAPTSSEVIHRLDDAGTVKAWTIERYGALTLSERSVKADAEVAARLLADAWLERPRTDEDARLLCRMKFAGLTPDLGLLAAAAAYGRHSLSEVRLVRAVSPETLRVLDRQAPEVLILPSRRSVRLEYGSDGTVGTSVKLQALFGLSETPRVGPERVPVTFSLLAPNGRPVQVTRDLQSFWDRTYPEIRKELRGRYPKHAWPEDPRR